MRLVEPILKAYQEQQHLLVDKGMSLCPADQRIQVSPAPHQHTRTQACARAALVLDFLTSAAGVNLAWLVSPPASFL